ncbi:acyltransferase family protein [Cellulomonas edaphi]|uniref:Acyltransferase n=1 Tax=Cellulomonas edaphi TaxID=3053468 RepID=A0ABT7SAM8_9CELL|nr:acyltransferase [Cellulomons edaphi]MDM7832009.1 acyltransferase [Cellulomons edaphi]
MPATAQLTGSVLEPATATPRSSPSRPRYAVLDALRFVAAAAVVAYHLTAFGSLAWGQPATEHFPTLHRFTAYGVFGVPLFFVISGFVILMSASARDVPAFVASRVGRLFPAYWVAVIATGVLLVVLWPEGKAIGTSRVLANLTMLQSAFGAGQVDGVYWTLWAELRFYVLVAVLLAVGMTAQRLYLVVYAWPALAYLCLREDFGIGATVLVAEQAPYFAGGMALYLVSRDRRALVAWGGVALNLVLAATVVGQATSASMTRHTQVRPGEMGGVLAVAICFALVALAVLTPLRRVRWAALTGLGALTYPLYLLHQYWAFWVVAHVREAVPAVVALAVAVGVSLAMAFAVHRWVERPWSPRLRRRVEAELRRAGRGPDDGHPGRGAPAAA